MASLRRIQKLNRLFQKELSKIILKEVDLPQDIFITLTQVKTSSDLSETKVYISVFPEKKAKTILDILKRNIYTLQKSLDRKLRMRRIPKIVFFEDKGAKHQEEVEKILEKIKKNEQD
ncbi:30S ribosome-binding factor RbfA [bacterium]|nr:30S ribosome-binding factor RbfA [bacterium]